MFDFPASPVLGQLYQGYAWDGEKWAASGTPAPIAVLQGYLFGCGMSTPGASASLTVQPGFACDSTGSRIMKLLASTTKTTAAWAVGNAGGLDTGTIGASSWYYWFIIQNTTSGVVDVLFSLSPTAPTLPIGYTAFRRIGAALTSASQWKRFFQFGDEFMWDLPVTDVNNASIAANTPTLGSLSVPPGILVKARGHALMSAVSAGQTGIVSSPLTATVQSPTTPVGNWMLYNLNPNMFAYMNFDILTSNGQLYFHANALCNWYFITSGWIDNRGRLF